MQCGKSSAAVKQHQIWAAFIMPAENQVLTVLCLCVPLLQVRVVTERAYHALFMHNMLIRPTEEELADFGEPDFIIYNAGELQASTCACVLAALQAPAVHASWPLCRPSFACFLALHGLNVGATPRCLMYAAAAYIKQVRHWGRRQHGS